jgi:hypothetical protein
MKRALWVECIIETSKGLIEEAKNPAELALRIQEQKDLIASFKDPKDIAVVNKIMAL